MKCKRPLSILLTFVMLLALLPAFALPVRADAAVRIDAGNFPDPVFREYVEKKCDGDSDGLLSESEIAAVKKIEIREDSLVSVQGIEFFTALEKLSCGGQWDDCGIAVVDLSRNTALTELSIFLTQITALDLSRNTALEKLWCASNFQLEALDISGCSKLIRLETYWTKLTELDISACPAIIGAYLAGSQNSIRPSWLMGDEPEATYPYYWEYKSDEGYLTVNKEVTVLTDRQPAVSFDANGGSGEMAPVKVEKGSGYILPECAFTPPEGWEFDRWDKGEAGLELVIASDTTLTAQWKKLPVPCTVSFDPDGGSGEMESLTVETGGSVVLPECAFTPPEGMEFDGWALGAPGTVVVIEADTAVKALWKAIPLDTRTVIFDAGGGSGEMASVTVEKGKNYTLPECAFTAPEGMEFDRWNKGEAGAEIVIETDTALVALWKTLPPESRTVIFDANGGSGEMEAVAVEKGRPYTLPECAFTPPEGKEFDRWDKGEAGEEIVIETDTALKALWKDIPPETRTVVFDAGGGSGEMEAVTVEKGGKFELPECAFTAPEGKEFDQWNKGEAGEEIVIETDTAIVALWKDLPPKAYTVSFDAAGGVGEMEPVTVEIGKTYRLPACGFTAPEGMEFDAWAQGAPGERIEVSGDMTVTAVWKEAKPVSPFEDVPETAYFYDAVMWAYYAEPQVTNGIDATHFGPFNTVTRGQAVTFLWRAMGCPEPESTVSPFEDVTEGKYFYKAVLWAVEKGVTNGTDKTHFTPNQTCSTAHILTFLYRTMGVGDDGWYEVAEAWAKGAGLLEDLEIKVAPGVECPRCDVVLFLCRALAE